MAIVTKTDVEAFNVAVLLQLARYNLVPLDRLLLRPFRIARMVSSVPFSLKIISDGTPRTAIIASNSRATRAPDNEVSTSNAGHSRDKA
ncbi:hypothetical protein GCM10011404_34360 [Sphingomonas prati]|nr:hypothetical protein GCM10011404_34360 [Sphingomonas prati]